MLTLLTALQLGGSPAMAADTYDLDPSRSKLYVIVRNDTSTLASGLGHDHAISAERFDGTVTWDVSDASACDVDLSLQVEKLEVDPPGLREHADLDPDGAVGDSAKQTIQRNFSKKSQLWAERYPTITYASSSCSGTTGTVQVTGALTIRGVTKSFTVPMQVTVEGATFRARGRLETTHQAFGFKPYSNLAGALRNQDSLEFVMDLRGTRR